MEIIDKIQGAFNDVDEDRVISIARTCFEMVTPLRLKLALCRKDQNKLKIIQSKRKEAKDKIKEMAVKSQYAVDLYYQHLDIEYTKQANDQPFTVPVPSDDPSIFKVDLMRFHDAMDENNGVDHLECALANAQKACAESILWIIFYSELEDMEQEVNEGMSVDKKKELAENTSSVKEYSKDLKIEKMDETGLPVNGTIVSSKYLQIFKEGGAELFAYLQSEYILDDHSPVAKYSYIYRFLAREQFIIARSQSKYMVFINDTFVVKMSKIFRENYKYKDDIYPILSQLKSDFEKRNKLEILRKRIE